MTRLFRFGARILGLCMLVGAPAFAAEPLAAIPASVSAGAAAYAGAPAPDRVLHLAVTLPMRNTQALDAFLADLYEPSSPNFRHYLSVADFTDRFGRLASDYAHAVDYFSRQGLVVTNQAANRYVIALDADVSDVERVFHVKMGLYRHPTENRLFFSPDRAPTLDASLNVATVVGLDDFIRPHPKSLVHTAKPASRGGSGPNGQLTGNDIRKAYYPSGTLTGAGQSVGLMELSGLNPADVALFFSRKYGPSNSVTINRIKTDSLAIGCSGACDDGEQALDVEYLISMAPGLSSVRVYIGNLPLDVLNAMASDNLSKVLSTKVLSTSWGWNENFKADDPLFKEFAAQGQTNLTASGDNSSLSASGPWPEEDANIIAVGGTDLSMTGKGTAWSGETGWASSAGGPSLDKTIKIESYQLPYITSANAGSKTVRNVPDIAASANEDMYICTNGSCQGGWGGTSFASPIWAGFIALANQYALQQAKPVVGFINPLLYSLGHNANYSSLFHDETKGESGKFSCTSSYDLVTGLGSPTGQALILQLAQ